MGYDASTDNCYPNTTILINKLGIKDEKTLQEAERNYSARREMELRDRLVFDIVNFEFYKSVHKYIFQDIYEWAGKTRSINISKKGTSFCPVDNINSVGNAIFNKLNEKQLYKHLTFEQMIDEATDLYDTLNILHPFREGNGRTERLFFSELMKHIGYEIDFDKCDRDLLMISTIYAAQGNKLLLRDFFASNIVKCDSIISKLDEITDTADKIADAIDNGELTKGYSKGRER